MKVGIIDAQSGNLTSLENTLQRAGFEVERLCEPQFDHVQALILPGQGRFGFVMQRLKKSGFIPKLKDWIESGNRIVGICVGMQVLFSESEEDPQAQGLAVFPEKVQILTGPKRPLMGWINVQWKDEWFRDGSAYFVNSYGVKASPFALAGIPYGQGFVCAVQHENVTGFQFHPEKSGIWGKELLTKCLS